MNHPIVFSTVVLAAAAQSWQISKAWQANRHHDPRQWTEHLVAEVGLLAVLLFSAALALHAP